jgi:hypothetical protein
MKTARFEVRESSEDNPSYFLGVHHLGPLSPGRCDRGRILETNEQMTPVHFHLHNKRFVIEMS